MDRAIPPSPAPSVREHSPAGLHPLSRLQDPAAQPRCPGADLDAVRRASQSPALQDQGLSLDPSMAYPQPFAYSTLQPADDRSVYPSVPQPSFNLSTPEASPPTAPQQLANSPSAAHSMAGGSHRATQGMKVLAVKSGRVEKTSPPRKRAGPASASASPPAARKDRPSAAAAAASGSAGAAIEQPLSILTKDWDMPVVDIAAYVSRSAEERRHEVERGKVPGKVKRAMNAFMLYRKAYQDRAKKWAQQSNHQVVSKVCGQSWSLEPESVRRQFNDWAVIERDNHRNAHPEYKFTPAKPRKKGKDDLDDESDLDDPDWEGASRRDAAMHRSASRTPMLDHSAATNAYAYPYGAAPPHLGDVQAYPQPYHVRTTAQQHMASLFRHPSAQYDATDAFLGGGGGGGSGGGGGTMQHRPALSSQQHLQPHLHHQHHQHQQHHQHSQHQQHQQQQQQQQQHLNNMAYADASAQQSMSLAASAHHHQSVAAQQHFDLATQYSAQTSGMAAQPQPLGPSSHSHSSLGMGGAGGGGGQQIDPSLMAREAMAQQYDLSNPVLAAGSFGESQWPSAFGAGAEPGGLYAGPYLAIEEAYVPDTQLQYLHGEDESWKPDPGEEADEWQQME